MIAELLCRLHRDQRGQVLPLMILGIAGFVLLVGMVINTGQSTADRMLVQNGADAAVITQASWAARSLNIMAMNNVGQSQMFTAFMVTEALSWTMAEAAKEAIEQITAVQRVARAYASACGIFYGVCYAAIVAAGSVIPVAALAALGIIEVQYRPISHGVPTSIKLMNAFAAMNQHIVEGFPALSGQVVRDISNKNGVDEFFFYPPCEKRSGSGKGGCKAQRNRAGQESGTDLPVVGGDGLSILSIRQMCRGADQGTTSTFHHRGNYATHGFPQGYGPYTYSGAGSGSERHARNYVNKKSWIYVPLVALYWEGMVLEKLPGSGYRNMDKQEIKDNSFTRRLNDHWDNKVCGKGNNVDLPSIDTSAGQAVTAGVANINLPFADVLPRLYRLKGSGGLSGLSGIHAYNSDDLQILVFARRSDSKRMFASAFENALLFPAGSGGGADPSSFAVAQAILYNPVSYDLYTQSWKARLVPTVLLDGKQRRKQVLQKLKTRASEKFSVLQQLYSNADSDQLDEYNVH